MSNHCERYPKCNCPAHVGVFCGFSDEVLRASNIMAEITSERERQNQKWGEQNHEPIEWLAILQEETGELSKEVVELHFATSNDKKIEHLKNYRTELIQIAAVAVQMLEHFDRTYVELK